MHKGFVGLIIMDGLGLAPNTRGNAVALANTPVLDELLKKYPNNTLEASGEVVGLPEGQMGNSEVGHLNLGAGRTVFQSLTRVNVSIKDGSFYHNKAFLEAIDFAKRHQSKLHVFGLIGDGGVHSHQLHIKALFKLAEKHNLKDVYLHAFLDGRDTPPTSAYTFLKDLLNENIKVATVSGRYYAMDRDNNWDRLQKAIDNMIIGNAPYYANPLEGIKASYDQGITDEFMHPIVTDRNGLIAENDAVIFANFRPDRAIRIATAFSNPVAAKAYQTIGKSSFNPHLIPKNLCFVSMMNYAETVKGPVAFDNQNLIDLYGDVIERNGLKQLRIAETEKYAHVTFFFDGGLEKAYSGSTRILVESPKVTTYDLKPEMSAFEVKERAVEAILTNKYQTMILNFANPDMVGHTGSIPATIKAVETVDYCVGEVLEAIKEIGGVAIVLADHGNAEKMIDENNQPHTAHTTNLVPVIITDPSVKVNSGALKDVAPTMLELLGLEKPAAMTGVSLIKK
ncbi:MAG: 2,3-bisphosphoglycerate-independent phosphoglycerate mutase [Acholeplasmataceae bacterium]